MGYWGRKAGQGRKLSKKVFQKKIIYKGVICLVYRRGRLYVFHKVNPLLFPLVLFRGDKARQNF